MYNDFFQNTLPQLLEDVDLATRQCLWIQQDSASSLCSKRPHYVRNIESDVPQADRKGWPFRSSDLTP